MPAQVLRAFFAVLLCLALGLSWLGWAMFRDTWGQAQWPQVMGVVEHSELVLNHRERSRQLRAALRWHWALRYRYQVDGRTHIGERYASAPPISDADGGRPPSMDLKILQGRHPVGAAVAVYYDPGNPANAVLKPTQQPAYLVLLLGLGLLLVSAALALRSWRRARRARRAQAAA